MLPSFNFDFEEYSLSENNQDILEHCKQILVANTHMHSSKKFF